MDRPDSIARRRTLDLPAKPEAGLAEWTSKIKALQRQVDEDEEVEHRRLEQEIAASRLARIRRSTGFSQANSPDLSERENGLASTMDEPQISWPGDAASTLDKQKSQEDALRKLTGENRRTTGRTSMTSQTSTKPPKEPMSLAAFIGGRATGPKLTKHAPQQDAHDSTQFEQRTTITVPHPIFGRGGVAMPGMTHRETSSTSPLKASEAREKLVTVSNQIGVRDRKISTPTTVKTVVEKREEQALVAQRTGTSQRQRTISTPSSVSPVRSTPSVQFPANHPESKFESGPRPASYSPGLRSTTPQQSRYIPTNGQGTPPHSSSPTPRSIPSFQSSPSSLTSSQKPPITTPLLARPIQPSPRTSLGPQIPLSQNPSPAFLRTPPQKEPTPSISRLQGRGFVKSIVQASSQLQAGSPPTSPLPDRKDSGGRKQAPVLERWQFGATASSPSPPLISPKPAPLRKSRTEDPSSPTLEFTPPKIVRSDHTGRSLKSAVSLSSIAQVRSSAASDVGQDDSSRPAGLGSSTTLISYIKPVKTGDKAVVAVSPPARGRAESPEVDELGIQVRARSRDAVRERVSREFAELPSPSRKPLNHLTKDRAKKPRKARSAQDTITNAQNAASPSTSITHASVLKVLNTEVAQPQLATVIAVRDETLSTSDISSSRDRNSPTVLKASSLENKFEDDFFPSASDIKPLISEPPSTSLPDTTRPLATSNGTNSSHLAITPPLVRSREKPPKSPIRHGRIPSTGNRATVMDVAQAFQDTVSRESSTTDLDATDLTASLNRHELEDEDSVPRQDVKSIAVNWGPNSATVQPSVQADKRKPSNDRYSAIVMPPLEEERTPVPSPAATLPRTRVVPMSTEVSLKAEVQDDQENLKSGSFSPLSSKTAPVDESTFIHIECADEPFPHVDFDALLKAEPAAFVPDADAQTVSVDVMSIIGNTATSIMGSTHVFYDTEILAVIHRAKARSTGLVSTKVWTWRGKHCTAGEREERKLQELARRYGTFLVTVYQYCESAEFVSVLGGKLVTRQGTRAHWSPENTTMHLVRSINGVTFIDELELSIRNLCSGFSYCLSLLDTFYVWHGCGSTVEERRAAREYAQALSSQASSLIELVEGETDNDEMFWMILGDGEYANADYWKWRSTAPTLCPRLWSVNVHMGHEAVLRVQCFADQPAINDSVYVIDCIWEYYVLVGGEARGNRQDIRLALSTASEMSRKTSSSKPFSPTVHVLILPSQIPTDLRLNFRDLDESDLVRWGHFLWSL
ncbi:hypothetical protein AcV7_004104 [Taiwanofungus camphoratus]|nr:hypothetical protein AcV7_004104 [Antrodia cinnamomea]